MLGAIQALTGVSVGVYSPTGAVFTPATRYRIGNVPANIRKRKNALSEAFQAADLAP
jgi:hypothetical protein